MGNCRQILLLLFSVIFFAPFSFAGKTTAVPVPVALKQHFLSAVYQHPLTPAQADNQDAAFHHLFLGTDAFEDVLVKKVFKLKKKYKRVQSSSTTLRVPVREIAIIPQNIYIKETYSKPFFVSPLHRFLFRLTPF